MNKIRLSLIAAMAHHRVIGFHNQLPWHLPADLKHFKSLTLHKPVLMGRRTFEAIGKPLPNRQNIIITRDAHYQASGCETASSIETAIKIAQSADEIMFIGGAEIYAALLPIAHRMYLTLIDLETEGDAYFPEWNPAEWKETSRSQHLPDDKNPYAYHFITLDKLKKEQ